MKNKDDDINHNFYFFKVSGKKWGLDIGAIREVGELSDIICKVPHAQYSLLGYMNVRGEIHQIISLRSLLAGKKVDDVENGFVLFLKDNIGHATGLYIDEVCEISEIRNTDIEEWKTGKCSGAESEIDMAGYLTRKVLRSDDEIIPLIKPERILEAVNI